MSFTLEDINQFLQTKQKLKNWIIEKCDEFDYARDYIDGDKPTGEDYKGFTITEKSIFVKFESSREVYYRHLPLDDVFKPNFEEITRERFVAAQAKKEIAKKEAAEIELRRKRDADICQLKRLLKEYPNVVNELKE